MANSQSGKNSSMTRWRKTQCNTIQKYINLYNLHKTKQYKGDNINLFVLTELRFIEYGVLIKYNIHF